MIFFQSRVEKLPEWAGIEPKTILNQFSDRWLWPSGYGYQNIIQLNRVSQSILTSTVCDWYSLLSFFLVAFDLLISKFIITFLYVLTPWERAKVEEFSKEYSLLPFVIFLHLLTMFHHLTGASGPISNKILAVTPSSRMASYLVLIIPSIFSWPELEPRVKIHEYTRL